ncbi:MAG: dihydrodipicolinate reductase C-terminal domain-containing protein [Candidatus Staskawiczbacteria bacterium]
MSEGKITVMVAGLPGNMASLITSAIAQQEDMELYICGLAEESGEKFIDIANCIDLSTKRTIHLPLIPIILHESFLLRHSKEIDIIVDFTQPTSVNHNAELYCKMGIPFVMGTTGGDRNALEETIRNSKISAVVATNMASPVIVFQEMIKWASKTFPQALAGYTIEIVESHQSAKKDISGTAISMLPAFNALGMPFAEGQIVPVRIKKDQLEMGVPEAHLNGHAWHTYRITSQDGTVCLEFKHNINGRNVYAGGVLKAIRFLSTAQKTGHVWSMADVLRG